MVFRLFEYNSCQLLTEVCTVCISSGYVAVQVPTLYKSLFCGVRFSDIMSRISPVIVPIRCYVCILVLSNLCCLCMSWIVSYSYCGMSLWLYTSAQVSLLIETRPCVGTPHVYFSQSRMLCLYCILDHSFSPTRCDPPHLCITLKYPWLIIFI